MLSRIRVGASTHPPDICSTLKSARYPYVGVRRVVETNIPTRYGFFKILGYKDLIDGAEHVALIMGDVYRAENVLVRLHSECLTGESFGSLKCDCKLQLQVALAKVASVGRGVCVYLRGHEGRGIGLLGKLQAYELQSFGRDTIDANLDLGLPADAREYRAGAEILTDLGVQSVRLLTNNIDKQMQLENQGIRVSQRTPLITPVTRYARPYMHAKRDRMGHDLPDLL